MAFTEVFTALQQGTVDGQENPLSVITAAKLDQVQKYLSLTGHVYSPAVFLMNKAQWDKLSDADKQAFLDAAKEAVRVASETAERAKGLVAAAETKLAAFGDVDGAILAHRAASFKTAAQGGPKPSLALPDDLVRSL